MGYTPTYDHRPKQSRLERTRRALSPNENHSVPTDKRTAFVRAFLGMVFVVSGLNGFLHFLPQFTLTGEGANFIDALVNSYFWPLLKVGELILGAALLFNVFSEFAIFVLAPLTLGILWFHTFVSPPGAWFAWSVFAAEVVLVVTFRHRLKRVFFPNNGADDGKLIPDDDLRRV